MCAGKGHVHPRKDCRRPGIEPHRSRKVVYKLRYRTGKCRGHPGTAFTNNHIGPDGPGSGANQLAKASVWVRRGPGACRRRQRSVAYLIGWRPYASPEGSPQTRCPTGSKPDRGAYGPASSRQGPGLSRNGPGNARYSVVFELSFSIWNCISFGTDLDGLVSSPKSDSMRPETFQKALHRARYLARPMGHEPQYRGSALRFRP